MMATVVAWSTVIWSERYLFARSLTNPVLKSTLMNPTLHSWIDPSDSDFSGI